MNPATPVLLDVRGLEPPEPMVRIIEALNTSSPGTTIEAITERRPLFLLAELDYRNQPYACSERTDGGWLIRISVPSAAR